MSNIPNGFNSDGRRLGEGYIGEDDDNLFDDEIESE